MIKVKAVQFPDPIYSLCSLCSFLFCSNCTRFSLICLIDPYFYDPRSHSLCYYCMLKQNYSVVGLNLSTAESGNGPKLMDEKFLPSMFCSVFLVFTQFMTFFFEESSIQALEGAVIILLSPREETFMNS